MLVVPPPLESVTVAQIAKALLTIALTSVIVAAVKGLRRKLRIANALRGIPGPKGVPLLGILPDVIKHSPRINEYLVRCRCCLCDGKVLDLGYQCAIFVYLRGCRRSCWSSMEGE